MYQFVDRPLQSLDAGCRFLVWSMRTWVVSLGKKHCPAQSLAPAFAKWRMIAGLQPFHHAMTLFNRDGLETFAFCPLPCDHVSEHEALILELVSSLRERGAQPTRETLELLIAEDSVADVLEALSRLGSALAIAGIFPGAEATPRNAS